MSALIIFAATFGVVFCLGFQSINVNQGNYKLAFLTSTLIGVFNLVILKMIPAVHVWTDMAAYIIGGPIAIMTAMYVHARWVRPHMKAKSDGR